jgi:TetR/AcrR family transcriptional regulator, fatty acid metabolism regulator protein
MQADNSRSRLLTSGKTLFARLGYENTATSAVAREAGTSESQLVRYFGSKIGLLEAIFDEHWKPVNTRIHDVLTDARDGRTAVLAVLSTILSVFEKDEDLATIFLLEGRRIRGGSHDVRLSSGFREFSDVVHRLIKRGQKDGSFATTFDSTAVAAALMGAVEGMVRERVLARRGGAPRPFSDRQVQKIAEAMLQAFGP